MSEMLKYDISDVGQRERLREELEKSPLSINQIAERAGMKSQYLYSILSGVRGVTGEKLEQLKKIVNTLDVVYVLVGIRMNAVPAGEIGEVEEKYDSSKLDSGWEERLQSRVNFHNQEISFLSNQVSRLYSQVQIMANQLNEMKAIASKN